MSVTEKRHKNNHAETHEDEPVLSMPEPALGLGLLPVNQLEPGGRVEKKKMTKGGNTKETKEEAFRKKRRRDSTTHGEDS